MIPEQPFESPTVTLVAPAKLTISLRITGVRGDGYHLIDAEMVTLDLVDELDVRPGEQGIEVEDLSNSTGFAVPLGKDNLVERALRLVDRRAGVLIRKRIPAGAGLGGGSADAAAILRWAGWTDLAAAAALGADVAFCLVGGRARVRGIGEQVEPLAHRERVFTLATPPFGCSTAAVYAAWDRLGRPRAEGPNDLVAAALAVEPRLKRWHDDLAAATGEEPVLAGSGSTWFVEGSHPGDGRVVARTIPSG